MPGCCAAAPSCSMEVTPFEPLVQAARWIFGVLVLSLAPPHLVPKMQCTGFCGERGRLRIDEPAPLERTNRAEYGGRLDETLHPLFCHHRSEVARTQLAPAHRIPILRSGRLQRVSHDSAADRSLYHAGADDDIEAGAVAPFDQLRGKDVFVGQIEWP